jgi:uncharacterized membrane protein
MDQREADPPFAPPPPARRPPAAWTGPFLLGASLCLIGVLIAWMVRASDDAWRRDRVPAWLGCALFPVLWLMLFVIVTVMFTFWGLGVGEVFKHLLPLLH